MELQSTGRRPSTNYRPEFAAKTLAQVASPSLADPVLLVALAHACSAGVTALLWLSRNITTVNPQTSLLSTNMTAVRIVSLGLTAVRLLDLRLRGKSRGS